MEAPLLFLMISYIFHVGFGKPLNWPSLFTFGVSRLYVGVIVALWNLLFLHFLCSSLNFQFINESN